MGSSTLRSKPTIHNGALNNLYRSQQLDRSKTNMTKDSYAVSDRTTSDDHPRSPVSPMESNGETWKYPSRAQAPLKGVGTLYEIPLPTSPKPEGKTKNRLSRPFEQPHPVSLAPGQGQATLSQADPHRRRQPVPHSKRKAAPAPIFIPAPGHPSRHQREPSPHQENRAPAITMPKPAHASRRKREDQAPAQRSVRQQNNKAASQRPARHEGWNPVDEPPRHQRAAPARHQDRHRDDLEWRAGMTHLKNRSKHDDPQYESGRRCFIFMVICIIMVVVVIVVAVERNKKGE